MEWLTATNSQSKGPKPRRSPSRTRTVRGRMPCSLSLASRNASVSLEPTTGMSDRSRSRYGTPPMWSSWPWVSTTATMSSSRSRIEVKSGRITSTPGWVSSGNSTPQSTISSLPACSKTVMLRPISPRPPRAMTRSPPSGRAGRLSVRGVDDSYPDGTRRAGQGDPLPVRSLPPDGVGAPQRVSGDDPMTPAAGQGGVKAAPPSMGQPCARWCRRRSRAPCRRGRPPRPPGGPRRWATRCTAVPECRRRCAGSAPDLAPGGRRPSAGGVHGVREGALPLDSMTSKAAVTRQPGV
ncbi:hypothetical protein SCANM63S_03428 [Streptomyces canarius]